MFSKLLVVCLLLIVAAEVMEGKGALHKRKVQSNIRSQPEITHFDIPPRYLCMNGIQQQCRSRVSDLEQQFLGLGDQDTFAKLAQLDLGEICTPLQGFRDCALASSNNIQSCQEAEQSDLLFRLERDYASKILDYVCQENFEVINREKSCLLKLNEEGQPVMMFKLMMSCAPHIMAFQSGQSQDCIPVELQQCAKNVIAEECGDDIATVANGLADLLQDLCKDKPINPVEQPSIPTAMKRHAREFAKLRKMLESFF